MCHLLAATAQGVHHQLQEIAQGGVCQGGWGEEEGMHEAASQQAGPIKRRVGTMVTVCAHAGYHNLITGIASGYEMGITRFRACSMHHTVACGITHSRDMSAGTWTYITLV